MMVVLIPLVESSQIALVVVAIVFGTIATVATGLRLLAARVSRRGLDASDWCILVAWVFTVGLMVVCVLEAVLGGFGWHYVDILAHFGPEPITQYHKIILPLEMLWTLSLTATKLSVLFFYTKVFAVTTIYLLARITMVLVALLGTAGVLSTMLICHPFAYNWNLSIPGGYCGSQSAVFAVFGIMNLATDVAVLTMPIPSLLGLRMPFWKKASLLATFTVGFFTCIASIIRLIYLSKIDYNDVTYTSVTAVLMTAVEPSMAVMLACIPLLRPLLGQASRRFSSTTPQQRSGKSAGGLSTWMSSGRSRSKTFSSARRRSALAPGSLGQDGSPGRVMIRLGSSETALGVSGMRSAILHSHSRYDSDEAMELRYVLSPGEGVSHHTHVEALPQKDSDSMSGGDETIRQQIQSAEAGKAGTAFGFAIVVKQEWNVASEPKSAP